MKAFFSQIALQVFRFSLNSLSYIANETAGNIALNLFCTPRKGRYDTVQPSFLKEAKQKDFFLGGDNISTYHWPGSGSKVLLLHGWESNTLRWEATITALRAKQFDVYAIDAPAHGSTGSKYFTTVLYAQMLEVVAQEFQPDILIGHSAGGMACVYYLSQIEKRGVEKLILLATPSELSSLIEVYRSFLSLNHKVIEGVGKAFIKRFGSPIPSFSMKKYITEVKQGGLLIHDKQDPIAHYAEGVAIHENWKASKMISTEGLGHSLASHKVIEMVVNYAYTAEKEKQVNS